MLPAMAVKPRIAIVGAGNLGSALAHSLQQAGYRIDEVVARPGRASLQRARSLARRAGGLGVTMTQAQIQAEVVWFCVPDGEIPKAAQSLAPRCDWKGKVAIHSSGALSSDELAVLRRRGALAASVHPLMTFVRGSRPALAGVPFALEGDAPAVRAARRIVRDLRGLPYPIRKQDKAVYHAWATFASPLLIALLAATERVAAAAGLDRKSARRRMLPILRQTLANYARLDAARAFSGPIVRGDVETVRRHLRALGGVSGAREVYLALADAAVRCLPGKHKNALRKAIQRERR